MASRFIEAIRRGQRLLGRRKMVELAEQRGLISAEQADTLVADAPDVETLVQQGHLSQDQAQTLRDESVYVEILATVNDTQAPEQVKQAARDPARRVGRYVLVAEIGAGGMGVVWRGWDTRLSRWVAVKQLKINDAALVSRFMREASLLARLSHPNITAVYEIGVHYGMPFLVMQLIEGGSPKLGGYTRSAAAQIVRDAAQAVQYAHDQGIVHRDLKPSNLLLDEDGRVFVTDFGLARMREGGNDLTASGALLGTPAYMASEQAQGLEADERTDVYGLGACLYGLVKGQAPFSGEIVHELVKRVAMSNPPVLEGTDDLVVIAQKAMERDREDRYASAGELAEELQRFIDDEPIAARPLNSVQRGLRRARRNPRRTLATASLGLVIAVVISWGGSELYQDYVRQTQIDAAAVYVNSAQGMEDQLSQQSSIGIVDPDVRRRLIDDLRKHARQALEVAPGLALGEFYLGRAAMFDGDYTTAQTHFDAALADDSYLEPARVYRMVTYTALEPAGSPELTQDRDGFHIDPAPDTAEKRSLLARIARDRVQLHPDSTSVNLVDAIELNILGQFDAAVAALNRHIEQFPIDYNIRSVLLYALLADQEYEQTIEAGIELIESKIFVAEAFAAMAFAYAGQVDYETAIALMGKSTEHTPAPDNNMWIGSWQMELGDDHAALATYNKTLDQYPDDIGNLLGRVTVIPRIFALDSPEMSLALTDAKAVVERQPGNAYAWWTLGNTALHLNPDLAMEALGQARALDAVEYAGWAEAMMSLAHYNQGDVRAAVEDLKAGLAVLPERAIWREMLARFHYELAEYDLSLATLTPLLDADVESAVYLAAQIHENLGQVEHQVQRAQQLIAINRQEVGYYFILARGQHLLGQTDAALRTLERAAAANPNNAEIQQKIQAQRGALVQPRKDRI